MKGEGFTKSICVRISEAERRAMDELAERLSLKAMTVARLAMRIGLKAIEEDPTCLLSAKATERGPKKK